MQNENLQALIAEVFKYSVESKPDTVLYRDALYSLGDALKGPQDTATIPGVRKSPDITVTAHTCYVLGGYVHKHWDMTAKLISNLTEPRLRQHPKTSVVWGPGRSWGESQAPQHNLVRPLTPEECWCNYSVCCASGIVSDAFIPLTQLMKADRGDGTSAPTVTFCGSPCKTAKQVVDATLKHCEGHPQHNWKHYAQAIKAHPDVLALSRIKVVDAWYRATAYNPNDVTNLLMFAEEQLANPTTPFVPTSPHPTTPFVPNTKSPKVPCTPQECVDRARTLLKSPDVLCDCMEVLKGTKHINKLVTGDEGDLFRFLHTKAKELRQASRIESNCMVPRSWLRVLDVMNEYALSIITNARYKEFEHEFQRLREKEITAANDLQEKQNRVDTLIAEVSALAATQQTQQQQLQDSLRELNSLREDAEFVRKLHLQEEVQRRQREWDSKLLSQSNFYDMTVKVSWVRHLFEEQGWSIEFYGDEEQQQRAKDMFFKSIAAGTIGVVGEFGVGKSTILSGITKHYLKSGDDIHTEGFAMKTIEVNKRKAILIDVEGSGAPTKPRKDPKTGEPYPLQTLLQEARASEDLLRQLTLCMSDVFLLIIGQMSHKDQIMIYKLCMAAYQRIQRVGGHMKKAKVIVVHNLRNLEHHQLKSESFDYVQDIRDLYDKLILVQGAAVEGAPTFEYLKGVMDIKAREGVVPVEVEHYFISKIGSEGNTNEQVFEHLRDCVVVEGPRQRVMKDEFVSATQNAVPHFVRLPALLNASEIQYNETKGILHVPCKEVPPTVERPLGNFLTMTSESLLYNVSRQTMRGTRAKSRGNKSEVIEVSVALVTFELPGLHVDDPDKLEDVVSVSPLTDDSSNVVGVKIKLVGELYNIPPSVFTGRGPRLADVVDVEDKSLPQMSSWSMPEDVNGFTFVPPADGCVGPCSTYDGMRPFVGQSSRRLFCKEVPIIGISWIQAEVPSVSYVDGLLIIKLRENGRPDLVP